MKLWLAGLMILGFHGAGCSRIAPDVPDAQSKSSQGPMRNATSGDDQTAADGADTTGASPADAQDDGRGSYGSKYGIRPSYEACMTHQPDGVSTAGHRQECADQELEFQDARLNRVYGNIMAALESQGTAGSARASSLRNAQRAWLSQLDDACAAAAGKAGSTMGPAAQSTCFMDQTAQRANELENEYGDASN